ncbi:hypothetical protein ACS0TY_009118 [Phlomoides rotata]
MAWTCICEIRACGLGHTFTFHHLSFIIMSSSIKEKHLLNIEDELYFATFQQIGKFAEANQHSRVSTLRQNLDRGCSSTG